MQEFMISSEKMVGNSIDIDIDIYVRKNILYDEFDSFCSVSNKSI